MTIKEMLQGRKKPVEQFLSTCLQGRGIPERLLASMQYSLDAGGKRIRPVLINSWCELGGGSAEFAMPFAASMEMIHTYSLIHDDLPPMDDDDLRRGKPSNHKQFDEATAILAGDGLNTEAFSFMADACLKNGLPAERVLRALSVMAFAAGSSGMVGGQCVDMEFTGRTDVPLDELRAMHAMKTGALIRASCECGAILSGRGEQFEADAREYGNGIGVAFQIVDDVLDIVGDEATLGKPVGSDEEQGKTTYPSLVGLERSREMAREHIDEALAHLKPYSGPECDFLAELARYIVDRAY